MRLVTCAEQAIAVGCDLAPQVLDQLNQPIFLWRASAGHGTIQRVTEFPNADEPLVELNAWQAKFGAKKKVPIATGGERRTVTIRIPKGVKHDTCLRLRGQQASSTTDGVPGDILLRVRINNRRLVLLSSLVLVVTIATVGFVGVAIGKPDGPGPYLTPLPTVTYEPTSPISDPPSLDASPGTTAIVIPPPLDFIRPQDCVRNEGTDQNPNLVPSACERGAYKVLKRVNGTTDTNVCNQVNGSTAVYILTAYTVHYRNGIPGPRELNISRSFVICLRDIL